MLSLWAGADQVLTVCPYMLLEVLKGIVRSLRKPIQSRWVHVALGNMAVRQKSRGR